MIIIQSYIYIKKGHENIKAILFFKNINTITQFEWFDS